MAIPLMISEIVRDFGKRVFERYIVLSNRKRTGEIRTIFDDRGSVLFMAKDERLTSAYENEAAVAELS